MLTNLAHNKDFYPIKKDLNLFTSYVYKNISHSKDNLIEKFCASSNNIKKTFLYSCSNKFGSIVKIGSSDNLKRINHHINKGLHVVTFFLALTIVNLGLS